MASESENAFPEVPWQRVRPISLVFVIIAKLRQWIIPIVVGLFSAQQGSFLVIGLGVLAFAILLTVSLIRFFTLQFRLAGGELQVREGIIFRSNRTVPVNRIQNIDLVQNVLHRIFRVAEVRIETASGKEPEAVLQVLSLADVEELRSRVFVQSAAGTAAGAFSANVESEALSDTVEGDFGRSFSSAHQFDKPRQALLALSLKQLALAGVASDRGLLLVPIALGGMYEFGRLLKIDGDAILKRVPQGLSSQYMVIALLVGLVVAYILLKVFSIAWYVIRFYGYQLQAIGDDLRIECGLFTRVSATIPKSRIQFISIHRSWLGRKLALASIRIETAGGGGKENENASQSVARRWFVPVIWEHQVAALIEQLRPGIQWTESQFDWRPLSPRAGTRLRRFAVIATGVLTLVAGLVWRPWGAAIGLVLLPALMWVAWRAAKSMRYARVGSLVLYRSGVMTRKVSFTFNDKIQTLRLSQSPFDRRWKMATLSVDTAAAGPAEHRIAVKYMDAEVARQEFADLKRVSIV